LMGKGQIGCSEGLFWIETGELEDLKMIIVTGRDYWGDTVSNWRKDFDVFVAKQ